MDRNRPLITQIQILPLSMQEWTENIDIVCTNNQWKFIGDQLPKKSPIKLKDNSNEALEFHIQF